MFQLRQDQDLIEQLRGNESQRSSAIRTLSAQCKGKAMRLRRKYRLTEIEIQDALTDALVDVDRTIRLSSLQSFTGLKTMVIRAMVCNCIDIVRGKYRNPKMEPPEHAGQIADRRDFIREMAHAEDLEKVQQAIGKLGETCRKLLIGFFFHHYETEELATICSLKDAGSVKSTKSRCLKTLRSQIQTQSLTYN